MTRPLQCRMQMIVFAFVLALGANGSSFATDPLSYFPKIGDQKAIHRSSWDVWSVNRHLLGRPLNSEHRIQIDGKSLTIINFKNGVIVRHETGTNEDIAHAITGRTYSIYTQNGFLDGKLGPPISDLRRRSDESIQYFQKGWIKLNPMTGQKEVKVY